jgi:hypothetical protein
MPRDDDRLAQASVALRRHAAISQDRAVGVGKSRYVPRLIEDGRAGELRLNDIRRYFAKLGGSVRISAWFEGATLDRLIDAEHAPVVDKAIEKVLAFGWSRVDPEVSFNEFGDRGSIDFFGAHEAARAVLVGEAKSAWGSMEETLRSLDVKVRLAPTIALKRFGWKPASVGVVLAFPESGPARRVATRFSATLFAAFPARNREIREWLRRPSGPLRGLWFLSVGRPGVQPDR